MLSVLREYSAQKSRTETQKLFLKFIKKYKMTISKAVIYLAAAFVILFASSIQAVDRNKFRTCQQSSFCRRCRGQEPGVEIYSLDPATLQQVNSAQAEALISMSLYETI